MSNNTQVSAILAHIQLSVCKYRANLYATYRRRRLKRLSMKLGYQQQKLQQLRRRMRAKQHRLDQWTNSFANYQQQQL